MGKEKWKDIQEYEGLYQISSYGRVKSLNRITPHNHKKNAKFLKVSYAPYGIVSLCKDAIVKTTNIHVLVATAFVLNPDNKPWVNHKDGNKRNNHNSNLEWSTRKENAEHAAKLGLVRDQNGAKNNMVKLTEPEVIDIKSRLDNGETVYSIHKYHYSHLHQQTIYGIKQKRLWKHL